MDENTKLSEALEHICETLNLREDSFKDLENPELEEDLELLEEALRTPSRAPKTNNRNLHSNIDKLSRDIRSLFRIAQRGIDKTEKNASSLTTMKAAIIAAALEIRRQVKTNQKEISKLRKELEKESKAIKKEQENLLKTLKDFKKMVDLYMNPPSQMAPISRKTLQAFKGLEKS